MGHLQGRNGHVMEYLQTMPGTTVEIGTDGITFTEPFRMCKRCGFRPVTRGHGARYCDLCRSNDKHRNNSRRKSEMVVSVDSEGTKNPFTGSMDLFTLSYGREDGTSDSILTS